MTDIVTKVSIWGQVVPIGWGSEWQEVVYLTQAEYDALPASKLTDGKIYKVKTTGVVPGGSADASDVEYDNTTSGLTADNVQDAIDEVNGKTNNVINKVNYLEVNWWFFPLIADNIIYSGSSFSYLAEEDTLLYISDAADSYLKIDGGNIAGQYTPWYIHVAEWQTITYSRNCKVYKANNTLVIDDTNVTLWLMDDKYLWPVNYQDNQVSSINSAHLGNNKVATATWTWDLEFHFDHEFNTQHSKMDKAELVLSGDLKYGDMWTMQNTYSFKISNWNIVPVTSLDIDVAKWWYFIENGVKYSSRLNGFTTSSSYTTVDMDILELDNNLQIVNTTNVVQRIEYTDISSIGWAFVGKYRMIFQPRSYRNHAISVNSTWISTVDPFTNSIWDSDDGTYSPTNIYYKWVYYHFAWAENNIVLDSIDNEWNSNKWLFTTHVWTCRNKTIWVDTDNDELYLVCLMSTSNNSWLHTRCFKYNIDSGTTTEVSLDSLEYDFDINENHWGWYVTMQWNKMIPHTKLIWDLIWDVVFSSKWLESYYITEINWEQIYTAKTFLTNNNNLQINNVDVSSHIIWYNTTDTVNKIVFWSANFTTTDTVSIDVTIKNNSWESRTVTLPKSWWSVNSDTTTGTWTTFTFNS